MTPLLGPTTQTSATPADAAQHRKLVDAAQQFEAMFLNEMLKSANFGGSGEDAASNGSEGEGQNGTMQSFGTESVSKAIASAGGFGIARHIVAEVEKEHAQREAGANLPTPLKSNFAPPIRSL